MYKRIRDGLFDPKKIVNFIDDKVLDVILFIAFFGILLTAPTLFNAINFDISYDTKSTIIEEFKGDNIPFRIENGELVQTSSDTSYMYKGTQYAIVIGDATYSDEYPVVFKFDKESLKIESIMFSIEVLNYMEYEESTNLDFSDLTSGTNETWDQVFKLVYNYIDDRPVIFIVLPVLFALFANISVMLLVGLIISLGTLFRLSGVVKFGKIYKLNIYCLGPFCVGALLDALFGINLIYLVGVIITFIYSYITQIEIFKKVYSHHTEG